VFVHCAHSYFTHRSSIPELKDVVAQFSAKFGRTFVKDRVDNDRGDVHPKLVDLLTINPPSLRELEDVLVEVAASNGIPFNPSVRKDGGGGDTSGGSGGDGNVRQKSVLPPLPQLASQQPAKEEGDVQKVAAAVTPVVEAFSYSPAPKPSAPPAPPPPTTSSTSSRDAEGASGGVPPGDFVEDSTKPSTQPEVANAPASGGNEEGAAGGVAPAPPVATASSSSSAYPPPDAPAVVVVPTGDAEFDDLMSRFQNLKT